MITAANDDPSLLSAGVRRPPPPLSPRRPDIPSHPPNPRRLAPCRLRDGYVRLAFAVLSVVYATLTGCIHFRLPTPAPSAPWLGEGSSPRSTPSSSSATGRTKRSPRTYFPRLSSVGPSVDPESSKRRTKRKVDCPHDGHRAEQWKTPHRDDDRPPRLDRSACVPSRPWQTTFHPACNSVHEVDAANGLTRSARVQFDDDDDLMEDRLDALGRGGWRSAWRLARPLFDDDDGIASSSSREAAVLKTLRWTGHDFTLSTYRRHTVDAMCSDRMSSSGRVVNIYGFCGQSVLNEVAPTSLTRALTNAWRDDEKSNRTFASSLDTRLGWARGVALAIAEVHEVDSGSENRMGFPRAEDVEWNVTIAHKDIKPDNIVLVDGKVKLNDFNDAELLYRNTTDRRPCKFRRHPFSPHYRSPEEAKKGKLTHAVDVFALGGVVYYLLTGRKPHWNLGTNKAFTAVTNNEELDLPPDAMNGTDPALVDPVMDLVRRCRSIRPGGEAFGESRGGRVGRYIVVLEGPTTVTDVGAKRVSQIFWSVVQCSFSSSLV